MKSHIITAIISIVISSIISFSFVKWFESVYSPEIYKLKDKVYEIEHWIDFSK